jgi:hypothetical protein
VRSFPKEENRLFLPPHARKTQISTFCFFALPEVSDLFTLPSHCRLTTWAWPIPFCQVFLFPGCVHKKFCNLVLQRYAHAALRCFDADRVRSMVRPLHVTCLFAQLHEPSSRNKLLQFTCSLFLTQNLALRLRSLCRKVEPTWILQEQS